MPPSAPRLISSKKTPHMVGWMSPFIWFAFTVIALLFCACSTGFDATHASTPASKNGLRLFTVRFTVLHVFLTKTVLSITLFLIDHYCCFLRFVFNYMMKFFKTPCFETVDERRTVT